MSGQDGLRGEPVALPPEPVAADDNLRRRIFSGAAWGTAQSLVMLPINFVGNLLVARFLGPGDLGEFVALTVFLMVATPLLDLGFSVALQQWAGRAVARGDDALVVDLFRKALGFHVLVQQPFLLLGAYLLLRGSPWYLFAAFAVLSVVGSALSSVNYWLAANNRLALGAKRSIVAGVLGNIVLVAVAAGGGSPQAMWVSRAAVQVLPALAVLLALTSRERRTLLSPRLPRGMPEGFWRFALPMWLTLLLGAVLSQRTEVFLLRAEDLAVEAGVFAVAFGLATQVIGPLAGLHASLGAAAVTMAGTSEAALTRTLARGHDLFSVATSLLLAGSFGLYYAIPLLYGSAYRDAAPLFLLLVAAATLQGSLTAYGAGAVVRQQRRRLPAVQAGAVVLDLGLAVVLIPFVGVWGAAAGAAAGLVAVNVGLLVREEGWGEAVRVVFGGPWCTGLAAAGLGLGTASLVDAPLVAFLVGSSVGLLAQLLMLYAFQRQALKGLIALAAPHLPAPLAAVLHRV